MPISVRAGDGSIQTFPDGTSPDAIQLAMTAYNNRNQWGGLAGQIASAVGQGSQAVGTGAMEEAQANLGAARAIWDFPGKIWHGWQIANDEVAKWRAAAHAAGRPNAVDNEFDAQRHAEWAARMARELGPGYANFITGAWEMNPFAPDTPAAHAMDRYNNSVGLQSIQQGRPYTLDNLQLAPGAKPKAPWPSGS